MNEVNATPHTELIAELMNPNNPKNEREHAAVREIERLQEALAQPAKQEPVALKWQQAPIRTAWGDDMVVASVAIDNDHTLSLYCERDQTPKVDAMFTSPPPQRTWVGLTDDEKRQLFDREDYQGWLDYINAIETKLRSKNT